MMLFRPEGLIPEGRHKRELEFGVADTPFYDVQHEGADTDRERGNDWDLSSRSRCEGVRRTCGHERHRLHDPAGSIVSLIGPNGAGKTTFFNMLTGVYKATSGQIVFDGVDVSDKPPHAITALGVGRTFQNIRLFQHMTALENVLVGMHCRLKGGILGAIIRRRACGGRSGRPGGASSCAFPPARPRQRDVAQSLLRRPAPPRGRARSRPSRSCSSSTSRRRG